MSHVDAQHEIESLSRTVAARMGLHYPVERHADLWRGVEAAAHDLGFDDATMCARWLTAETLTRKHIEILASHLTIGETYFFREPATLNALRDKVLPELIQARRNTDRRIRIWSAGCCTGEEPYSVAMILDSLIPDRTDWDITILATDINPLFLHTAGEGRYRSWSFRTCPEDQKLRYFTPTADDRYSLADSIRHMVTFEYLNLADDHYPSLLNNTNAMDIIICRNVLIYFESAVAARMVSRLANCLVDGGHLVVAPSEASLASDAEFDPVRIQRTCLYRRSVAIGKPIPPAKTSHRRKPVAVRSPRARRQRHPNLHDPARLRADRKKAEALYEEGQYPEALSILRPYMKAQPHDFDDRQWGIMLRIAARSYANQGLLDDAEHWCRRALEATPHDSGLHYLLAMILQEEGRPTEARNLLQSTVSLDPRFVLAHFALGALSVQEGQNERANQCFEDAIVLLEESDPDTPVPESEGIPAARLIEIIRDQQQGAVA